MYLLGWISVAVNFVAHHDSLRGTWDSLLLRVRIVDIGVCGPLDGALWNVPMNRFSLTSLDTAEGAFRRYVSSYLPAPYLLNQGWSLGLDIVPIQPDLTQTGSTELANRVTWVQANL